MRTSEKSLESLESELVPIYEILKTVVGMNKMTAEEEKNFKNTKNCYACKLPLGSDRVKDHCHITGKYRGPAHNKCNLRMKVPKFIPVLFHNLEGYDAHLFVKSLGYTEGDIKCIPKTDEKYISFSKIIPMKKPAPTTRSLLDILTRNLDDTEEIEDKLELRFLDSLKFTQSSLDALASNLGKDQFWERISLDPMCYHTTPGLALDAALKVTNVNLELLTDPIMYLMVESGIRGGISTNTKRYAKANNKYMENYDEKEESVYIPYLDANNLYGWAMSQPLPTHGFKWMTEDELPN